MLSTAKCQRALTKQYQEMSGKFQPIHIKVSTITSYAAARTNNKTVYLHPLTLLEPSDLPRELQVSGPNDPKLQTSLYFRNLKTWLSQKFSIPEKEFTSLRTFFDFHLRLWEKPHLIKRVKKFAIAHELGHIFHNHTTAQWDRFFAFVLTLFFCFLIVDIVPLALYCASAFVVADASQRLLKALRQYSEQYQEIEADKAAIKLTGDFPAAKAFFKGLDAHYKRVRDSMTPLRKIVRFITAPERFFHLSHPSPQTRIAYLEKV